MANISRPRGFEPKGLPLRLNEYQSGGVICPGDAVILTSAGQVAAVAADGSEYTGAILGVAQSYASAAAVGVKVADHPDQQFIVASDGTHPNAQTDLNLNYSIIATAPDTHYFISRQVLKNGSGATTATLPLKLLAIVPQPLNSLAANADCIVAINNHQLKGGTGTAGT